MRDSKGQKIARQYTKAILDIDRLRAEYEPDGIDCVGRIATALVQLYEMFENYEPDLMKMTAVALAQFRRKKDNADVGTTWQSLEKLPTIHQHLMRHRAYFLSPSFKDHVCVVLQKRENGCWVHYGYSRRKLLKFIRAETLHASTANLQEKNALKTLQDFMYEEADQIRPVFALRRDFIHFANVIMENENDSRSAYEEPIRLKSGESHSLTTIESVVFSICNEHAQVFNTGQMNWNKTSIAFDLANYSRMLPKNIADNIVGQSAYWNRWNAFRIVG